MNTPQDSQITTARSGSVQPVVVPRFAVAQLKIHMCVDIEGVIRWPDKMLAKLFTDDGVNRPGKYVRDWLKLQLSQGKRVLPMGDPCEGFSYQTGCPGHPVKSSNE